MSTITANQVSFYRERLINALQEDLDFQGEDSSYSSHNFHSFPAKFPPQLPRKFINELTEKRDIVLDPMSGSGTTVLEAFLTGRQGIGCDIDPMALLMTKVKTTPLDRNNVLDAGRKVISKARHSIQFQQDQLKAELESRWTIKTSEFINYWFAAKTQIELQALIREIELEQDQAIKDFLKLSFSAIIITKSGGVSLALDLAHTRPHRARVVFDWQGKVIFDDGGSEISDRRRKILTKNLRSPIDDYEQRLEKNTRGLLNNSNLIPPKIFRGDAQKLISLDNSSVDLIVTSPPYASNAVDYMRAHKFTLVWFGEEIDHLSEMRKNYIGGENVNDIEYEDMPDLVKEVVSRISISDPKKGQIIHLYYSEMLRSLREMYRVLRPGKSAIVVVGNSLLRGIDIKVDLCIIKIGKKAGFDVPAVGVRNLDRDKRILPSSAKRDFSSRIQQRIHQEFVIGLLKPLS